MSKPARRPNGEEFVDLTEYGFVLDPRYYFYGWTHTPRLRARQSAVEALLRARASLPPGCEAGVIGAAIGVGAGIGAGIYFIHRGHTSLTGCVRETEGGLSATAKDGNNYQLVNAPSQVKAGERFSLRGHKITATSGRAFRVDHVSRDYGACSSLLATERRELLQGLRRRRLIRPLYI